MGCFVSDVQIALMRGYTRVILAGDMDIAGKQWTISVGDRLTAYYDPCSLSVIDNYAGCKDPAEVLEKKAIMGEITTYIDWSLQKEREKST
jgi:DNA primase